ncbi:MAG: hypothetical protein ABW184_10815 [Sphingobium sp.]
MRGALAALAVLLTSPSLAGEPPSSVAGRPIACNPPLDRPLRLIVTQHLWPNWGGSATVTLTRILIFRENADGLSVEMRLTGADTDQTDPAVRARMLMAYGGLDERPLVVRLDTTIGIAGIDDLAAHWAEYRRRQAQVVEAMVRSGQSNGRAEQLLRMVDAMPPNQQVAVLADFLIPVIRHCGVVAPDGATASEGALRMTEQSDQNGVRDVSDYIVDVRTGLLRSLRHSMTSASQPLRPLREEWTLAPGN